MTYDPVVMPSYKEEEKMPSWLGFMWTVITDKNLGWMEKLYGLTFGQLLYWAARGNCESMQKSKRK